MVNLNGNGNGNGNGYSNGNGGGIRIDQRVSWGNLLSVVSLGAGLAWSWQNLATSQARIEEQLRADQQRIQLFERDHDALTKLESQVDELWQAKFPRQGQ